MIGRGTRLHPESGKIAFKIYDYTNATRLFGADFITKLSKTSEKPKPPTGTGGIDDPEPPPSLPTPLITGLKIDITEGEITFLVIGEDGKHTRVSLAEYQNRIKHIVLERLPTSSEFVDEWVNQSDSLLALPEIQTILQYKQPEIDSFDIIAEMVYQIPSKTKQQRVTDFLNNGEAWFATMPNAPANTLRALADVFNESGTEGLTNRELFNVPHLKKVSGGSVPNAFKSIGKPNEVFKEFKSRIFTLNS
jgi:type I restriction enzyme R subunit